MLIGLGGGAASSVASGGSAEDLDFASVQRDNPEMERRAQEVIDRCVALADDNPILSIHDVGAGGLSNAIPACATPASAASSTCRACRPTTRRCRPCSCGATNRRNATCSVSRRERVAEFAALCLRERCPFAVVGTATAEERLIVAHGATRVDPRRSRDRPADGRAVRQAAEDAPRHVDAARAALAGTVDDVARPRRSRPMRVLAHPTVAAAS